MKLTNTYMTYIHNNFPCLCWCILEIRVGKINYYTTIILQLFWNLYGTTRVSWHQKGKTNLDLLEQKIVSGNE